MKNGQLKDIENGGINRHEELDQPFIQPKRAVAHEDEDRGNTIKNGSIGMVLLSTGVAVCGSFQFGICVDYSAPSQSSIRKDLRLSITEYSMFGSILSIGAVLGAFTSGKIAETLGRKGGAILLDIGISLFSYVVSAAGMFVGSILVGFSFSLKIYVAFFSIGMGAGPWVIMSKIFPIDAKGVGGACELVWRLDSFLYLQLSYELEFLRFDTQSQVSIVRIVHLVSVI
ncbi:hypothetical protein ACLB2K_037443 [Fragaria x ananassa]